VEKTKVLVIGGGFGGVFAAKALERQGRGKLEVELVNANNYFVFQPLLPEVAASTIHSADAVVPLRQLLRRVQFRQAEIMGIDFAKKTVTVVQGAKRTPIDLPYDELVIALGTGVDLKRFPGLPEHALTMKDLADAHRLRTHVIGCLETADVTEDPQAKRQLLTFVTVGAGFSGVETIAELRELVRRALKYYPNIKTEEVRFYLIEYANRILPTFPADLAAYATRRLKLHGIEVLTGTGVKGATSRLRPSSPPSATARIASSRRSGSICTGAASRPTATCACRAMTGCGHWEMPPSFPWSTIRRRTPPTTPRRLRSLPCARDASLPPISWRSFRASRSSRSLIPRRDRLPRSA